MFVFGFAEHVIKFLRNKLFVFNSCLFFYKMEILTAHFFIKALIASVLTGAACGVVGVWLYVLNSPFVGVAMAHAAFAGAVIGLAAGANPVLFAAIFCVFSSVLIGPVAERGDFSPNISTAVLFSFMLGLAFLFMEKAGADSYQALSFMWGNILTASAADIIVLFAALLIVLVFLFVFKKGVVAVAYNSRVARACGIPEKFIFYAMLALCAVAVGVNVKTVGGLLIYGLITIPPAAAAQFSCKLKNLYVLSSVFAVLSCVGGLFLSYIFDLPAGASSILFASVIFFFSFAVKGLK